MERPPKKYVCEKCGYLGDTLEHEGCDYLAWTTGEQLCIDQLERELALLKASPASVPEGWKLVPVEPTESMQIPSYLPEVNWPMRKQIYRDMIAAAPTPPVSEDRWQPIKTAPKDGTTVLLKCPHMNAIVSGHYGEVTDGDWETGYSYWMEWLIDEELWIQEDPSQAPTHWMPLPKAPAMQEDKS